MAAAAAASPSIYVSTRGGPRRYSFKEAVLAGWADDGGMLLPERIPTLSTATLKAWRDLTYPQLVAAFLQPYVDDPFLPLDDIVGGSFGMFASPEFIDIAPLHIPPTLLTTTIDGSNNDNGSGSGSDNGDGTRRVYVAELFHGPSLAFKDLGMQVLANVLECYLQDAATPMTFLVGTSGDTGPSALAAVAGKARMRLLVLYPKGRVSPTQEAQMLAHATMAAGDGGAPSNVRVAAVEGTSDDLDEPIAEVFQDEAYRRAHSLGSLNSVNVVRLLVQAAHYFYSYLQLTKSDPAWDAVTPPSPSTTLPLPRITFAIPTGAAGHVTAGVIAALMGLPVEALVMATNENDILHHMMASGALQKKQSIVPTNSPAMDIQAPYNIERILHLLARCSPTNAPDATAAAAPAVAIDGKAIRGLMDTFYRGEPMVIPPAIMDRLRGLGVRSTAVGRDHVLRTIREIHAHRANDHYLLDPHTAVGVAAAATLPHPLSNPNPPLVVCMGCAHPAKFAPTIQAALRLPSEAAAVEAIKAWARYPAAVAALDLVASLEGKGDNGDGGCAFFPWADRGQWRAMLEREIERLEAAAP